MKNYLFLLTAVAVISVIGAYPNGPHRREVGSPGEGSPESPVESLTMDDEAEAVNPLDNEEGVEQGLLRVIRKDLHGPDGPGTGQPRGPSDIGGNPYDTKQQQKAKVTVEKRDDAKAKKDDKAKDAKAKPKDAKAEKPKADAKAKDAKAEKPKADAKATDAKAADAKAAAKGDTKDAKKGDKANTEAAAKAKSDSGKPDVKDAKKPSGGTPPKPKGKVMTQKERLAVIEKGMEKNIEEAAKGMQYVMRFSEAFFTGIKDTVAVLKAQAELIRHIQAAVQHGKADEKTYSPLVDLMGIKVPAVIRPDFYLKFSDQGPELARYTTNYGAKAVVTETGQGFEFSAKNKDYMTLLLRDSCLALGTCRHGYTVSAKVKVPKCTDMRTGKQGVQYFTQVPGTKYSGEGCLTIETPFDNDKWMRVTAVVRSDGHGESEVFIDGRQVYSTRGNLLQLRLLPDSIVDTGFINKQSLLPELGRLRFRIRDSDGLAYFRFSVDDVMFWQRPLMAESVAIISPRTVPYPGSQQCNNCL